MASVLGPPEAYLSSGQDSYTLQYEAAGCWMDLEGRPCALVSIDVFGETRWIVKVDSERPGDIEAVRHYDLSPWWQGQHMERRRESRRRVERRHSERRTSEQ